MTSPIHNNDIADVFDILLQCSINLDSTADKFQRIAILAAKCKNNNITDISSQLEQLVADRKAIRLQKRGNHPHRQQSNQPQKRTRRPKSDDDEIIDKLPRRGPGFYNFLGTELFEKYNNGKLTKKEYRDAMDRHNEQINKEEQQHQNMNELGWLLHPDKNGIFKINNDIIEVRVMDILYEMSIDTKYLISDRFQDDDRITYVIGDDDVETIGPNMLMECFSQYSQNKYHPLHQHGSVMSNICTQLITVMDSLLSLFKYHDDGGISYDETSLDMICKHIIDTTTPSLKAIAIEIRSNIVTLQGGYYSKLHAIKVATTHPKYSKERGDAIRHMVNNNRYVPSKSALDRLMKMEEDGQLVVDDEWNTSKGGQKRPSILFEEERFHAIVQHKEQPSRAEVRLRRSYMNDYEKAVDICMTKTDEEVKEYLKRRGKLEMYADITAKKKKKEEEEEEKMGATKQKEGIQQPSREIRMEQLKARLRDEVPESNSPVQVPSYINDILSELYTDCTNPNRISKETAESIEHILTSDLKVNDDSVFEGIKGINAMIERDAKEEFEHQKRMTPYMKQQCLKYRFLRRKPFNPVQYVKKLVKDANGREWDRVNYIRQYNKEIHAKINKLMKEEQEEKQRKQEEREKKQKEQKKIDYYKQQYNRIGSLILPLHPVRMEMLDTSEHYKVYEFQSKPLITTALYSPPKLIEVCNKLGLTGERLYFNPKQFPVTNLATAGDNDTFQQLKRYIVNQSSVAGNSPVVFHGTDHGCKRFSCKHVRCKFSFLVKWDQYGYYICISRPNPSYDEVHWIIHRKCVVGCEFHSH